MERFIIADFYDFPTVEVIGRTNSIEEANKIRDRRYDDTDDEADVYIFDVESSTSYSIAKEYGLLSSH